jgi:putative nucleotidyltransferase with HDIG domain
MAGTLIRILLLDDEAGTIPLMTDALSPAGIGVDINRVQTQEAFAEALRRGAVDVIVSDYQLAACSGLGALRLAQEISPELPFIFLSGTSGEDAAIECLTQGATDYVLKQKPVRLASAMQRAMLHLAGARDQAISQLLDMDAMIEGWARAMDIRNGELDGHTQRVVDITLKLASRLGCSPEDMKYMRWGALLHDVGKMGIPERILFKIEDLSDDELGILMQQPEIALRILSPVPCLRRALEIPCAHHEKWDGTGYPRGLKGTQIPFAARIFSVVVVWDALTSDRPYRPGWLEEEAIEYIQAAAGTYFDPEVVEAFMAPDFFGALTKDISHQSGFA